MPVYAIAQGTCVNRALHDDYVAKAIPTLEAHGAKILAFSEDPDVVEGKLVDKRFVLLEFPRARRSTPGTTRRSTRRSCRCGSSPCPARSSSSAAERCCTRSTT